MLAERNELMQRIDAVGARTQCRLDRLDEMCEQNGWRSPPDLRLVGDESVHVVTASRLADIKLRPLAVISPSVTVRCVRCVCIC